MKKYQLQKILIGLLCLIMLLQAFTACKREPEEHAAEDTTTGEVINDSKPKENYSGYLDEYRIIRPNAISDRYAAGACDRLTDALSEASGKEITSVVDNRQKDDGGKEILVGITNRMESEDAMDALDENEFSISVVGNKIVIAGENNIALDRGVKYFINNCIYGLQSVSEIKKYCGTDSYGYVELSDMNQYFYGEQVCSYSGCIQQDIAIDFATGDIYYFSHDQYCKEDAAITRRTPDGHQEYMVLTNFSHMEVCDIERVGDKVYIWTGSQKDDDGHSKAVSRIEFQAGMRYEWNAGETFELGARFHCPALDTVNDYVSVWGDIYDRERLLQGVTTPVANIDVTFPYEEVGYEGNEYAISGGYDICGSYQYTCWQTFDKSGNNVIMVTIHNANSELVDWTIIDTSGIDPNPEVNGIKVEIVDGVPRVFVAIASNYAINRRYITTIVVLSERPMDPVEPTMDSLAQLKVVEHNKLPKNASQTTWMEANGVFSIKAVGNMRLTFDEGAFKGEAYTYETSITMNGAKLAGINLACGANVSDGNTFYKGNNYVGAQILISDSGKLTVKETEDTVLREYSIPVEAAYQLKVYVDELGTLTVTLNGVELGSVQLTEEKYVGGHVGLFAETGKASFADTRLTYHHL